jgi:hypothetical protein
MANILQSQTLNAGADSPPLSWTITRPATDTTTSYVDAAVRLLVFPAADAVGKVVKPEALPVNVTTPALTLSIGSGLTRTTNTASVIGGLITITSSQLTTLLGATANRGQYRFFFDVQPVGFSRFTAFVGDTAAYDGIFYVVRPGFAGMDQSLVKV